MVVATHNPLFVELYDGLAPLYAEVLADDVDAEEDPHAAEHEELVRGIVEGRPTDAAAAVHAILEPLIDGAGG